MLSRILCSCIFNFLWFHCLVLSVAVSLQCLAKLQRRLFWELLEKHLKGNAIIGYRLHEFMREKSCLTNLIFYDKVTNIYENITNVVVGSQLWISSKLPVSHSILLDKLSRQGIMWWVKNWLIGQVQVIGINWLHQAVGQALVGCGEASF